MTVQNIYKAVRWCYDEEALGAANFAGASDDDYTLMNNIIKAHIGDALRWICLYAPAEILSGSDEEEDTGIVVEDELTPSTTITDTDAGVADGAPDSVTYQRFALPANFLRLVRVREAKWHRAVTIPVEEDSDEYLQLHDPNGAYATTDRPQAAIINKKRKVLEIWPCPNTNPSVEFTCIVTPLSVNTAGDEETTSVAVPPLAKSAFIYYLAFLTLSAYEDSRAVRMLEIAKMNLGLTDDKQRA